ncbi:cyclic nucleotide-binding domain-containing protein [Chitinophaga sp. SYP-B3965]|uniref:Crp/Fnr family transcriptional regulator n=1 Tax=Chitinophaga sp. SYP-B3965 TaxID=2663120 RepID=UPI0012997518|nr:Crp/Fnr family transcriptional regulator [Chitinophaga sp. SYP-B3965]MRG43859.1 cyclic nucleotide-binding domain-containing protein [Chitinophaga sp. SYP-B3965]
MSHPLIKYLETLTTLSSSDRTLLISSFSPRTVKEGEVLSPAGKICHTLFFICSGVLKIVMTNDKGIDVTYFFLKEEQFCTILHSFNNEVPAAESIIAACDAEVLAITKTALLELYQQLPWLKGLIDEITQQRLIDKVLLRNSYQGEDSVSRYRLFLQQQGDIALRVPVKDIASYLGITPQSLSRIRKNNR